MARDSRAEPVVLLVVALVLMGIVATVIPVMVHRYASRPLADLIGGKGNEIFLERFRSRWQAAK